jgi:type II secretory pathway pseudopilin PulG
MKQNKAFTLIEVLLSVSLILLFTSACVFNFGSLWNKKVQLDSKVENYITLSRYVQCNAELSGKKAKILIETNKVKVVEENFQGETTSILTLQPQLEDLNDQAIFESEDTNVVTYLPDGSIEKEGTVGIKIEDDENTEEQKWITIGDFNRITISSCHTNNVDECGLPF